MNSAPTLTHMRCGARVESKSHGISTARASPTQLGFTLVELIVVIVIIGILSVIAGPRFFSKQPFSARGYADEIAAALRHAQKVAVATGCPVNFSLDPSGYQAAQRATVANHCASAGAWSAQVVRPDGATLSGQPPDDANVAAATSITFGAGGNVISGAPPAISVGTYTITVHASTGLVEVQ